MATRWGDIEQSQSQKQEPALYALVKSIMKIGMNIRKKNDYYAPSWLHYRSKAWYLVRLSLAHDVILVM